ncbi:MAG: hypothetical protein LBH96_05385 [Candidatus Peribacteria bacterium]|jgi:hypothetical protein|nr:hypothetical protein [Candidatus Peribacteria bacterium]
MRTSYSTNQTFPNTSETQYIAPNGKIYYIEKERSSYYSPQMGNRKLFSNLTALRNYIRDANPIAEVRTHTKIESEESYTSKITYYKNFILYKTNLGWMSYSTPVGKYFSTVQELKNYLGG